MVTSYSSHKFRNHSLGNLAVAVTHGFGTAWADWVAGTAEAAAADSNWEGFLGRQAAAVVGTAVVGTAEVGTVEVGTVEGAISGIRTVRPYYHTVLV